MLGHLQADIAQAASDQVRSAGSDRDLAGGRLWTVPGRRCGGDEAAGVPAARTVGDEHVLAGRAAFGGEIGGRRRGIGLRVEVDQAARQVQVLLVGHDRQGGDRGGPRGRDVPGEHGLAAAGGHDDAGGAAAIGAAQRVRERGERDYHPASVGPGSCVVQGPEVDNEIWLLLAGPFGQNVAAGAHEGHLGTAVAQPRR